jgi:hypothetical protein
MAGSLVLVEPTPRSAVLFSSAGRIARLPGSSQGEPASLVRQPAVLGALRRHTPLRRMWLRHDDQQHLFLR